MLAVPARGIVVAARSWSARAAWMRALAPIVLMSLLWWSSSRELASASSGIWRGLLHNGMHVVAYSALGASFLLWFGRIDRGTLPPRAAVASILASVAYGVVDEVHQSFVRGRTSSMVDVASDALGAALAVAVLGALVGQSRKCRSAVPVLLVASAASVVLATFSPW